jgi:hypothetical protein
MKGSRNKVLLLLYCLMLAGIFLVAKIELSMKEYPSDPVAISFVTAALDIVLSSRKIPHEISPVHEAHLVGKEPFDIIWHR